VLSPAEKSTLLGVPSTGRRGFLALGGAAFGAAVLSACSDDDDGGDGGTADTTTTTAASDGEDTLSDLDLVSTAASLELAAVDAYQRAIDTGLVTTAAISEAALMFQSHHEQHLDALNTAIKEAKGEEVDHANEAILARLVEPALGSAQTEADIVDLAVGLEDAAAGTYVYAAGELTTAALRSTIMTIGGIEARHAAVIRLLAQSVAPADVFDGAFYPAENPLEAIRDAMLDVEEAE
jgi:rubrerythrin